MRQSSALLFTLAVVLWAGCDRVVEADSAPDAGGRQRPSAQSLDAGGTDSSPDAGGNANPVDAGSVDSQPDAGGMEQQVCDAFSSPDGGGPDADGSRERPWASLSVLAAQGALPSSGVLCLMDGDHGRPQLLNLAPEPELSIRAEHAHLATVGTLQFIGVTHVRIVGLMVDGTEVIDPNADERQRFLVTGDQDSSNITLDGVRVQSAASSATWDQQGWVNLVQSGVDFRGPDIHIANSEIRNTYHAVLLRGDRSLLERTLIDNFGGDAIRGLGSDSTYRWNTVRDAYIDEYDVQHDDAFQAYALGDDPRIANVTISHNRFIVFADPITDFVLDNALIGTLMQGIIITDGYADGWVVENNLIIGAQSHGVSLFGGRNCRIQNNTVVAHPAIVGSTPWIRISVQTKTGQRNFDNMIVNNIAQMMTPWDYDVTSVVQANLDLSQSNAGSGEFVNPVALDFHLLPTSSAVDTGVARDLAELDLDGEARINGEAVDLGAFER